MTDAGGEISRLERDVSLAEFLLIEVIRLDVGPYEVFFL